MSKDLEYYLGLPYTRRSKPVIDEEDGRYWLAWVEELPGCKVEGESKAEAMAKLGEQLKEHIRAKLDWGSPIPEPEKKVAEQTSVVMKQGPEMKMVPASTEEEDARSLSGETAYKKETEETEEGQELMTV